MPKAKPAVCRSPASLRPGQNAHRQTRRVSAAHQTARRPTPHCCGALVYPAHASRAAFRHLQEATWACVRFSTQKKIRVQAQASWYASWPWRCGAPSNNGCMPKAWAAARGNWVKQLAAINERSTWCCRWPLPAWAPNCACGSVTTLSRQPRTGSPHLGLRLPQRHAAASPNVVPKNPA